MDGWSDGLLLGILLGLIILSAGFSSTETGMMSLNPYRLKNQARHNRSAARALHLLQRPDRLLGVILLGNNFVNILASSISTILAIRWLGEAWIGAAAGLLTFIILVFAEVAPKTLAARHPERVAFIASHLIQPLLTLLYPLVWLVNGLSNGLLRLFGVRQKQKEHGLNQDELRAVINESARFIPQQHQDMLLGILDLEQITLKDIMVPRNRIVAIDIAQPWDDLLHALAQQPHRHCMLYQHTLDEVVGILDPRRLLSWMDNKRFDRHDLESEIEEAYCVLENKNAYAQLMDFLRNRRQLALVYNGYGSLSGLVTRAHILAEIIGEFSDHAPANLRQMQPLGPGQWVLDGNLDVRELNKQMHWQLPIQPARTLNGLLLEYLQDLPHKGTSIRIAGITFEIKRIDHRMIKTVTATMPVPKASPVTKHAASNNPPSTS